MGASPLDTMHNQATPTSNARARVLRREMTDSERKLWSGLRNEQLGVKFRRQHPLGNYIADFACLVPKLVVELDGSQHQTNIEYDARRESFIRGLGFDVIRFGSNEPFINFEGGASSDLESLEFARAACPHPCLPPEGEGVTPHAGPSTP